MPLKWFVLLLTPWIFWGCQTIEERTGEQINCPAKSVELETRSWSPWHAVRIADCTSNKKRYRCVEAPFTFNCKPYSAADEAKEAAAKEKKKKKK